MRWRKSIADIEAQIAETQTQVSDLEAQINQYEQGMAQNNAAYTAYSDAYKRWNEASTAYYSTLNELERTVRNASKDHNNAINGRAALDRNAAQSGLNRSDIKKLTQRLSNLKNLVNEEGINFDDISNMVQNSIFTEVLGVDYLGNVNIFWVSEVTDEKGNKTGGPEYLTFPSPHSNQAGQLYMDNSEFAEWFSGISSAIEELFGKSGEQHTPEQRYIRQMLSQKEKEETTSNALNEAQAALDEFLANNQPPKKEDYITPEMEGLGESILGNSWVRDQLEQQLEGPKARLDELNGWLEEENKALDDYIKNLINDQNS